MHRACLTECAARKPGNVHPGESFDDLGYSHFVTAAEIAAETLPAAGTVGVGPAVLNCVQKTVRECGTNVNLGIALLLAPLCAAGSGRSIGFVLEGATVEDAASVYEAIRLANPGGLGRATEQDVAEAPTVTLAEAMRLAANRDEIAREWSDGFNGLWCDVVALEHLWSAAPRVHVCWWEDAILTVFLSRLASRPDTHLARRCGRRVAEAVRNRVAALRETHRPQDGPLAERPWVRALNQFLREGRPRRNPGTTADLICAALFWAARDGRIELPTTEQLHAHAERLVRGAAAE
ncbi:MAG: triphosphoribosyl-dephospho-CoA synthase [Planctomycetota bacterium]